MTSFYRPALVILGIFTIAAGVLYPATVTLVAQFAFPEQANGSVLESRHEVVGSRLVGQAFAERHYFWSRPSATTPTPYNGAASGGSNLGPMNPVLVKQVQSRADALRTADPQRASQAIPVDLVTTSASGLDPHISPAAAYYQVHRVAEARGLSVTSVQTLVSQHVEGRSLGLLGEPRVNVLLLNMALDRIPSRAPVSLR